MSSPKPDDVQTEGSTNGDKIRVKFLFANRDGVNVEVECSPSDTVGMLKESLLSMWPKGMNGITVIHIFITNFSFMIKAK